MGRTSASRALFIVLAVVFVVGLVAYFRDPEHTPSDDKGEKSPPGKVAGANGKAVTAGASAGPQSPATNLSINLLLSSSDVLKTSTPGAGQGTKLPGAPNAPATRLAGNVALAPPSGAHFAPVVASGKGALADGKAALDAGDLLGGRKVLNDALISGELAGPEAATAKALIVEANQAIIFSPRKFPDDAFAGAFTVPPGGVMAKIAYSHATTPELLCRVNALSDPRRLRAGQNIKIVNGPFHAVVTKSAFTLDLYLGAPGGPGSVYVTSFPVGLGKDGSTPTGAWVVEPGKKLKDPVYYPPASRGGPTIPAGDPKNPLGKFWIALKGQDGNAVGKESYGIHGTIEPDSIGKQASMGCIRLKNEDVAVVYEMLVEGKSTVVVKD